ncbi:MAG: Gfo/Idh/MocA family oxidoreductase [Akkermansiaceae bacterium]|nr:Gfo/Idh/MocA family oxidoreductase [Akkermansiaceae bacterium]MCP5549105.1 Gfo/Idh/MocA family oxidoreductase [Akkermansiaceae bacterium]
MTARRKLRVGVIGTGAFADVCHIPGVQSHPDAEVAAVYGRRIEAARELAGKHGVSCATDDFDALCADPDIDAITIASANVVHAEQAIAALRNGKHVFCEKPLAMNAAEAREMAIAAEESGKVHQVAFTFRYNYGLRELRRRIAAGDIGRPFFARIQYDRWDGLTDGWRTSWREKKQFAGAGMLFDLGSHLFDITRHVLGPIDSVIGYTHVVPREAPDKDSGEMVRVETDDMVNAWIRHENGLRGQFFISRVTPPFAQLGYLEIVGEQGALKAALSRGGVDFLKASSPTSPEWMDLPLPEEANDRVPHALGLMMRSFVDACHRGAIDAELDADFHDGLAAQLAMSALLDSQEHDRWIRLGDVT